MPGPLSTSELEPPFANQDGAGIYSIPDWSIPPPGVQDLLFELRSRLREWIFANKIPQRLKAHALQQDPSPLFSAEEISALRDLFQDWVRTQGSAHVVDWSVPEYQPYALHALQFFANLVKDRDNTLCQCLIDGAPTGYDNDIPLSNVFIPHPAVPELDHQLSIAKENWQSATNNPDTVHELVQSEVQKGWLYEVPALQSAQEKWGDRVAVGKMSLVLSPTRAPRLVVDSTVCGTNDSCCIPERYTFARLTGCSGLLSFANALRALRRLPLGHQGGAQNDPRQGLRSRTAGGYVARPFKPRGEALLLQSLSIRGKFSALWFQRLAGLLLRLMHLWIFVRHALLGYVDDFLFIQDRETILYSASLLLCFTSMFGVPLSWAKLQLGSTITWIGWHFNFTSGSFCIPQDKVDKLYDMIREAMRSRRVTGALLHKLVGLLQWFCMLYKSCKPWLVSLFADLHRHLVSNYSVSPGLWPSLPRYLDDDLRFTSVPPGTQVPLGGKLLEARHTTLQTKQDLAKVRTSSRIWMRVTNPASDRRSLSRASRTFLAFWEVPTATAIHSTVSSLPLPMRVQMENSLALADFFPYLSQSWQLAELSCLGLELRTPAQGYCLL